MIDLDEGEKRLNRYRSAERGTWAQARRFDEWREWVADNAPALLAELRAARETIAAQTETIAALRGRVQCLETKDTCP
jgi:hypothetical protein